MEGFSADPAALFVEHRAAASIAAGVSIRVAPSAPDQSPNRPDHGARRLLPEKSV
jgi:hypothetical protein